ncbi:PTS sugar transporter subunit IIA [Streptococcus didelphis]|nr:PTS sugar transporter subunit IIA [Streptococcus didelphis]WMB29516.1 PTS sugar transporter subunit IIA [Streptococcus didelphis]
MDENFIFPQVSQINSATEALDYLSRKLLEADLVEKSFPQAIKDRELIFPTGLQFEGYGVAIPHTDSQHVKQTQIALMTLEKPVVFTQMASSDQEVSVQIVIMLAIKEAHSQVEMLQKLMTLLQDKELVNDILSCRADQKQK